MSDTKKPLSAQGFRPARRPVPRRRPVLAAVLLAAFAALPAGAAERPDTPPWQALPAAASYDPAVPRPADVLGFEVGERHVRHDQLADYVRRLAAASPRVEIEEQGRTHEGRPQLLLTISSPANLARREEIRRRHRSLSEPPWDGPAPGGGTGADLDAMPVVVWLGYSIHGDEASGANASLLVAYHLAAARGPEVESLLDRTIVLLDPSLNPDGLARFAHWVAMHRGRVEVADPLHREHRQGWPGARTNHYWFDLNRDWLLLQHPESRARVATLQRWRPNVLADFHEMGSDSTFFFQPGVPSRQNPLTPAENLELTRAIARFHAEAFDRAGRLYYTEETYDDFYYGKGSTYPDVQGAVGILFEQASSRGIRQETDQGLLTFADSVANQVRASFSTLAGAAAERRALLAWQREFYRRAAAEAAAGPVGGWIVGDGGDPARAAELAAILDAHGIAVHRLARDVEAGGRRFTAGRALVVPAAQRQARLAEALFERRTEFADDVFYDVSAWTLPLAFGLPWAEVPHGRWSPGLAHEPVMAAGGGATAGGDAATAGGGGATADGSAAVDGSVPAAREGSGAAGGDVSAARGGLGAAGAGVSGTGGGLAAAGAARDAASGALVPPGRRPPAGAGAAWAFDWTARWAPRALQRLLDAGIAARVATRPFRADTDAGPRAFGYGTVLVPAAQPVAPEVVGAVLAEAAREDGVDVFALDSGLTIEGIDLGSPSARPLAAPRPLLLVGHHVASYEAGEMWHFLDHRLGLPVALVDRVDLPSVDLGDYTHVILVSGRYDDLPEETVAALRRFLRGGGVVVATAEAAHWAGPALVESRGEGGGEGEDGGRRDREAAPAAEPPRDEPAGAAAAPPADAAPAERLAYADYERRRAVDLISGAIFAVDLDVTHPLAYGYDEPELAVFRDSPRVLAPSDNPYETVALYTSKPLLAGYASPDNVKRIAGSAALVATRVGGGTLVRFADDPVFRGYWVGTQKLLANTLYFGPLVRATPVGER